MEKATRNRLVRIVGIVLALLFLVSGFSLTETNANELSYGEDGPFSVDEGMNNQTLIVFAEIIEGNCPGFSFQLVDNEGAPVAVEKMDCSKWYADDSWQYRIGTLERGTYTYRASDDVSIVAVTGDVDEYLENYALGNGLADIGSCFCCLSFIVPLILGRMSSQTMDSAHHVQFNDSFVMPTPYEGPSESPATEQETEVGDEDSTTEVQDAEPTTEEGNEQPDGAFWGGLNDN